MKDDSQESLFDLEEFNKWKEEWKDMPEFDHEDLSPIKSIIVHFETLEDMRKFSKIVDQKLTPKTQSIWYPEAEINRYANKRYIDES